ncbi:hypothetical protein DFH09DRAFT_1370814 [Mycena vulgaris]|nr:hypothetical protein DFH09DRAFT_1370814 [Mycena vulgaris]
MKEILFALLSTIPFTASYSTEATAEELCVVQAWVRAEDLSPDHISHGELRVKVKQPHCVTQVASVALRLQLDEFGEVKFLKTGAVIPEIRGADNESVSADYANWFGTADAVYDYEPYDSATSDPDLWTIMAEERTAWSTEALLISNNPNFSQPIVTPFIVASPTVNYPPVAHQRIISRNQISPIERHGRSKLGYHYTAVVTFIDGRTVEVDAGYTTFVPTSAHPALTPMAWNMTFSTRNKHFAELELERCLPHEQRSTFTAEITLEDGNVVQRGQVLKGRVTVHASNGSTMMSRISVTSESVHRNTWARQKAEEGGDDEFSDLTSGDHIGTVLWKSLNAESEGHSHIFDPQARQTYLNQRWSRSDLTVTKPFFDFELEVLDDSLVDFRSYYTTVETSLKFDLTVEYSTDVAKCMAEGNPTRYTALEDEPPTDDAQKVEDGVWNSRTPLGQPMKSRTTWDRELYLSADVPITVIAAASSQGPAEHYLNPGLPSPILLASPSDITFPVVRPVFTAEALADTSARLMRPGTLDPDKTSKIARNMSSYDDPADPSSKYQAGQYAGLLWRKKIVLEERELLETPQDVNANAQQQPLGM